MRDFLLSYDGFYLRPKHSVLPSRRFADTSVNLCGHKFKLPVVPANMSDVISFENAKFLATNEYFYIMHRFNGATRKFADYAFENHLPLISVSIGVNDESKHDIEYAMEKLHRVDFITIDVAHGDHDNVQNMVWWLHDYFDGYIHKPKIIAGNVATDEGYKFLCGLGVDVVKVGIGGGSICSTKYKTGFHSPTAHSVLECVETGLKVPIIADGGAKHYGDVAKALTLGATMVMSGGWFASCIDSPAKIINGKKLYRGSTSYESKGEHKHIEGISLELEEGFTYSDRLTEIQQALQSAISYSGGTDLTAFNSVEWARILPFH